MIFFALMAAISLGAVLAGRLGVAALRDPRACLRLGMAVVLVVAGADHLRTPERYLVMMPAVIPFPAAIVFATGLAEIAGALGLLVPRTRRLTGIVLAIYFVCVFPANIQNAIDNLNVEGVTEAAWWNWLRLPFQPVAIWWALSGAGVVAWPFARRSAALAPRAWLF